MSGEAKSFTDEARLAYSAYRGSSRLKGDGAPPHWEVLPPYMQEALTTVYFLGRLDERESR